MTKEIFREGYKIFKVDDKVVLLHDGMPEAKVFNNIKQAYKWVMCIED